MLKEGYHSYDNALRVTNHPTLKDRRLQLCSKFAIRCTNNIHTEHMFPLNKKHGRTRHEELFDVPFAYTERFKQSAIPSMARQLNIENANSL